MLSGNQATILDRLSGRGSAFLHEVAEWEVTGRHPYGEDAARNALKRLEDRELVRGEGTGRERNYAMTRAGIEELARHHGQEPPPLNPDGSPTRNYIVLEQVALDDFDTWLAERDLSAEGVTIFVKLTEVEARNTEHALRQTAAQTFGEVDADPTLVPVAERMWQPARLTIRNRQSISIA